MVVEILVGNIASGKSTYANKRAEEGAIIINDDAIVSAIHGGNYKKYEKNLKPLYKGIETNILIACILLDKDVVIDRGLNVTKSARKRFVSLCNSFEVPCDAIVFDFVLPETHAKRRMQSDPRGYNYDYWFNVANRMDLDYQEPCETEDFRNIQFEKKLK